MEERLTSKERELVLKASKEIVIKFIEMGKVTPSTFSNVFRKVFESVEDSMRRK